MEKELYVIKVKKNTNASKLAGAIAGKTRDGFAVRIHAMGAAANYKTTKALALAEKFLSEEDMKISVTHDFVDDKSGDKELTVVEHKVKLWD